nr:hypothetical protein [Tanacetum cinerariifolium]
MTWNLGSRVFTLELRDLPHKINKTVNEVVKEALHVALQAPLQDRFRELSEADMKGILHQRMFATGTYRSLSKHVALYKALESSMKRANRDEFHAEKDKSRKRRHDDQDPPPPPDSDLSKKKRHNYDVSGSSKPSTPQSPAWKKSKTSKAPSSPPSKILVLRLNNQSKTYPCQRLHIYLIQRTMILPIFQRLSQGQNDQVDLVNPEGRRLMPDVSKPLPPGGPLSQVTIQSQFFFNKDLEYLVSGDKGKRSALSISKLKAAQYLNFRLEELVPSL